MFYIILTQHPWRLVGLNFKRSLLLIGQTSCGCVGITIIKLRIKRDYGQCPCISPWRARPSHWPYPTLLASHWSGQITWAEYLDASLQGISLSCVIITTKLSSTEKQNKAPPLYWQSGVSIVSYFLFFISR